MTADDGVQGAGRDQPLVRLRLDLSYDGSGFAGWAAQPGLRTVEQTLAEALGRVLRLAETPRLVVAGRTDSGVHARGQVCHVDVPLEAWTATSGRSDRPPGAALLRRLTGVLGLDVRVRAVTEAPEGFDARFAAVHRRYAYRVSEAGWGVDPLRRADVLDHRHDLDVEAMNEASARVVGLRDFAAFCRRRQGATTVRALLSYCWARPEPGSPDAGLVVATVVADAFCHSMVRSLVGALLPVGHGRRDVDWPAQVLTARRRDPGVTVAAARGLTLEHVEYAAPNQLAARARASRAVRSLP